VVSSSLWITEETKHLYPLEEICSQLALADVIVSNSSAEADMVAHVLGLSREQFLPVMNGVDARFGTPSDQMLFRRRFNIKEPFVFTVGNLEKRKNQLNLVRAMRGHGCGLVIIGHVREPDYANQVLTEGGPNLTYLGPIEHEDPLLASAYSACSAFVLPSTLETPGLAALEAAAAGAPLVITSVGATREYFGDMVHYVDPGDPNTIRLGIDAAITAGPNLALKAHMLANFTWPTVTTALPGVYQMAIERGNRRH
jgi:glycosyltransferase involved in cell wall biosynthesis